MPNAALRPCKGLCGARVVSGYCAACARRQQQRRGTAHSRGYTAQWQRFRVWFMSALVDEGISPVCGAILPDGPYPSMSACRHQGLKTGQPLHLHHEPPLQDHERGVIRAVCDPQRIVLLCERCHNALSAKVA
jgi:hypothetical protein